MGKKMGMKRKQRIQTRLSIMVDSQVSLLTSHAPDTPDNLGPQIYILDACLKSLNLKPWPRNFSCATCQANYTQSKP